KIGTRIGNLIPLAELADFRREDTLSSINHLHNQRLINVSAEVQLDKVTANEVVRRMKPKIESLTKGMSEYTIDFGGEDEDTEESMAALARAFIFAAFIIFSLLIVTFKNLFQPILILTSIPLGLMGVIIAMFLHNRPLSFMAMLGVIALAGVIVNNAIVLIDFINRRREQGEDLDKSVVSSAQVRLRPILLTTATTVSGLFPTAYGEYFQKYLGIGGGDPFIVPIALSLGWGLAFGAILTLIFFPSFVRILDDIRTLTHKLLFHHSH
ncbi:MAG: efflux RND transporter permease subunit, partial [Bdellovibrionales bacterium]|nr:efflux RND transporter permease subunit [Bdellovibrionales bacterium]